MADGMRSEKELAQATYRPRQMPKGHVASEAPDVRAVSAEVHRGIEAIEAGLMEYMVRSVDAQTTDVGSPEAGQRAVARYQAVYDADQRLWAAQGVLSNLVHPYLQQYGWWELRATPALRWTSIQRRHVSRGLHLKLAQLRRRKAGEGRMIDAR